MSWFIKIAADIKCSKLRMMMMMMMMMMYLLILSLFISGCSDAASADCWHQWDGDNVVGRNVCKVDDGNGVLKTCSGSYNAALGDFRWNHAEKIKGDAASHKIIKPY